MPLSTIARHEDLLTNLIHDLRQPLGTIETSVYLLNMVTPADDARVHDQLHAIECQLGDCSRLLSEATTALRRLQAQRSDRAESLDLTNPVTADVT